MACHERAQRVEWRIGEGGKISSRHQKTSVFTGHFAFSQISAESNKGDLAPKRVPT
jgi:hypothetical protein